VGIYILQLIFHLTTLTIKNELHSQGNLFLTKTIAVDKSSSVVSTGQSITVSNIKELKDYQGEATNITVTDILQGGVFNYQDKGSADEGVMIKSNKKIGFWQRDISNQIGTKLSWFIKPNTNIRIDSFFKKAVIHAQNNTGVLTINDGVYLVDILDMGFYLTRDLKIQGLRGTLKKMNHKSYALININSISLSVTFEGLTFDFNRANNLPYEGISYDLKNANFINCTFKGSAGLALKNNTYTSQPSYCNNAIEDCTFIDMAQHTDYPLVNYPYSNNTSGAVYIWSGGFTRFVRNKILNYTFTDTATSHKNPYGILIDNPRTKEPITQVDISDNYFYGLGQSSTPANGGNYVGSIYLYSGCRVGLVANNVFDNCSYLAIGAYNSSNITIVNNKIRSVVFNSKIQVSTGIIDVQMGITNVLSHSNIRIYNNTIDTFKAFYRQYFGIKCSGTNTELLKNVEIQGNTINGSLGYVGGYYVGNTSNCVFYNNANGIGAQEGLWLGDSVSDLRIEKNTLYGDYCCIRAWDNNKKSMNIIQNKLIGKVSINAVGGFSKMNYIDNNTEGVAHLRVSGDLYVEGVYNMDVRDAVKISYKNQVFRGIGSPEGVIKANKDDRYENTTTGQFWKKITSIWDNPASKNTGWVLE
jgi:hypothetical protein